MRESVKSAASPSADLFAETLSPLDAIRELGVHPGYLYGQLQRGRITARKDAEGRWEISRPAFDEWKVGYGYRRRSRKV